RSEAAFRRSPRNSARRVSMGCTVGPVTYRHLPALTIVFALAACTPEDGDDTSTLGLTQSTPHTTVDTTEAGDGDRGPGDGDGDGAPGDGDGAPGDGDGSPGDGDGAPGDGACMNPEAPAGVLEIGQPFSRWSGGFTVDGEMWDYCELEGTPFLLILSAGWCGPCQDFAAGLSGQASSWTADLEPVLAGLDAGNLSIVEIMLDNFLDFGPVALSDLQAWEGMFHNDKVHLLGDATPGTDGTEPHWIYLGPVHMGSVPAGVLVDANFNLEVTGLGESVAAAAANYGG